MRLARPQPPAGPAPAKDSATPQMVILGYGNTSAGAMDPGRLSIRLSLDAGSAQSLTSDHQVAQLTAPLQHVPLRPFLPRACTRFYVAPGLVLYVIDSLDDGKFDLRAGATHRSALQALPESDIEWISFDG
ncbi:hypothetical protein ABTX99_22165 [Streptomyces flaveolus]|uniref:hypothetical protein n=1 Tax=Streptomyces flaveolus TaxID=67297 RepID=UPI003321D994